MLEHGGNLLEFARQYQIPVSQWLDLSTGVSPFTYPCQGVPERIWNRLPELDDGLEQAASDYYVCDSLLAVAGSQAAIMTLPAIVAGQFKHQQQGRSGIVALPRIGYKEHQQAWQRYCGRDGAQWQLEYYDNTPTPALLARADVVVVINPNNPTGELASPELLSQWQHQLTRRGGVLIIDEAFIDCTPQQSMLSARLDDNVIILRSIGKFFGLAGARVGFVFGARHWLEPMAQQLGPWTIPGPSRWLTKAALQDRTWQHQQRRQLMAGSRRLKALLQRHFCAKVSDAKVSGATVSGTALFQTVVLADAPLYHRQFCRHSILTRLCDERNALRFGLPGDQSQWDKLESALSEIVR